MNLDGVISISGKSGLYKVVARSKNNIIVETLVDGKRIPAYATDRISALDDISIYTYEDNTPLTEVYNTIFLKEDGKKAPSHKDSLKTLEAYLREIVPNYDEERVYASDIKKLFQWYNILHDAGLITAKDEEKEETPVSEEKESESNSKPKKKAPQKEKPKNTNKDNAKKVATKKSTTKKTGAKSSKKG
jgi:hypothetical protein